MLSCFALWDPTALLFQQFFSQILTISGPLYSTFSRASTSIRQANAVGSRCSYYNKFNKQVSFCLYYNLNINSLSVNICISFLEMLASSGLSTATIATYISPIKAKCSAFDIDNSSWLHPRVALMIRACQGPSSTTNKLNRFLHLTILLH